MSKAFLFPFTEFAISPWLGFGQEGYRVIC